MFRKVCLSVGRVLRINESSRFACGGVGVPLAWRVIRCIQVTELATQGGFEYPVFRRVSTGCSCQMRSVPKVSQAFMWPVVRPRLNHATRWADVPWVKLSGTT
jgi:hypothetical protein